MQTVKDITPMSRTKNQMFQIREALKNFGMKQVILNRSKGKQYDGELRSRVVSDYVEFFVKDDPNKPKIQDGRNVFTFGMSYSYIGKEPHEQSVQMTYMEKTEKFNPLTLKIENTINQAFNSPNISVDEFLTILNDFVAEIRNVPDETAFFSYAIERASMVQKTSNDEASTRKPSKP